MAVPPTAMRASPHAPAALASAPAPESPIWLPSRLSSASLHLAAGETVILLHTPLPLVGVSIRIERGCQ